jgi:hypothetical protein
LPGFLADLWPEPVFATDDHLGSMMAGLDMIDAVRLATLSPALPQPQP